MKNKKKIIVGLLLVVVIALAMLFVKKQSDSSQKAKVEKGSKAYTFVVVNKDGKEKVTKGKTDAKYLKNLMDELKKDGKIKYKAQKQSMGSFVVSVNGERADFAKDKAYWRIVINKKDAQKGIDEQPVKNKDHIEFVYTPAQ